MCLLQGETKTISCYKVIFIFFAWNKLVLQSWLLGCSPWLTMWTRKSARESFSSDRWKKTILLLTELILWEMCNFSLDWEDPPSPPCRAGHDEPRGWVSKNIYDIYNILRLGEQKISPLSQNTLHQTLDAGWAKIVRRGVSLLLLNLFNLYFLFSLLEIPKTSLQQKCKFSQRGPVDWHRELRTLFS